MTESRANRTCVVGARQVRRALRDGIAEKILFAADADPALLEPLLELCKTDHIPVEMVQSMRALGRVCGIETGAAVAACLRTI